MPLFREPRGYPAPPVQQPDVAPAVIRWRLVLGMARHQDEMLAGRLTFPTPRRQSDGEKDAGPNSVRFRFPKTMGKEMGKVSVWREAN